MSEPDSTSLRILDANLNRAGEALRVWEEFARFQLEDPCLYQNIKQLRHDLSSCVPDKWRAAMLHHRDAVGDVGRTVETSSEYQRKHTLDVAQANGQRAAQALRTIEEYSKPFAGAFARHAESIRYRVYVMQRQLHATHKAGERFGHVRLYVLITEALCQRDWFETAQAVIQGGADAIQLREKHLSDRELISRARRLTSLCREHDALFIINDRPDIARLVNAHGVHLGQDDMSLSDARRLLPSHMIVGLSTHSPEQARSAIKQAPDYIAIGPMFASSTKPQDHIPGPALLKTVAQQTSLPLVAIGGIQHTNLSTIIDTASRACVCVCRSVISTADPAAAAADLCAHLHPPIAS